MKKTLLTIAAALTLLASCTTEENNGPNCGTAKFSWKEDGTFYEGTSDIYLNSSFQMYTITACSNNPSEAANVNFRFFGPLQVGTYNLAHIQQVNAAFEGDASYFEEGTGSYFTTDSTHFGAVNITSINGSAITGTFNMTVYRASTNETDVITDGQFTAIN